VVDDLINQFSGPVLALVGPFLFLLLCAFGFPMPEDIILIVAGLLGEKYGYPFLLVASITYTGIVLGDSCIFWMGTKIGRRLIQTKFGSIILKEKTLKKAESAIFRYGSWVIFGARFLPGLRTAVFFSSGTLKFPFWKFLLMDGLAALVSAPLFVFVGKTAWHLYQKNTSALDDLVVQVKEYFLVGVAGAFVVAGLIYLLLRFLKKVRQS